MGLIKHNDDYWEYESKNGLIYELYEGKTIGGDREYTSDIVFIMLDNSKVEYPEKYDDRKIVNWFYGATNWNYKETEETIQSFVDEYEEENPDIVEALQPPKRDFIMRVTKTGIFKVQGRNIEEAKRIVKKLDDDMIFWDVQVTEEKED